MTGLDRNLGCLVCLLKQLKICTLALWRNMWGRHQHFGKNLWWSWRMEIGIWLILIHCWYSTVPTEHNLCLDIHNNLKFSPRLCLWAVERKWSQPMRSQLQVLLQNLLWMNLGNRLKAGLKLDDDFYKHLVINAQTRTFEDVNYVNSIGSKLSSDLLQLLKHLKSLPRRTYSCSVLLYFWILPQHHKMQWPLETHHQVRYQKPRRKL